MKVGDLIRVANINEYMWETAVVPGYLLLILQIHPVSYERGCLTMVVQGDHTGKIHWIDPKIGEFEVVSEGR